MKVIAILIAKFLDPIGFVVAGLTVLASRKVVIIPIAAGASALVTETILSNTQLTYSWGNGL
ncbi:MAG: hypothetical protein K9M17_06075, partial [Mariprofundaceae bacterium]|nr:hypothetical protein [Mariprofundaceae bacterium]